MATSFDSAAAWVWTWGAQTDGPAIQAHVDNVASVEETCASSPGTPYNAANGQTANATTESAQSSNKKKKYSLSLGSTHTYPTASLTGTTGFGWESGWENTKSLKSGQNVTVKTATWCDVKCIAMKCAEHDVSRPHWEWNGTTKRNEHTDTGRVHDASLQGGGPAKFKPPLANSNACCTNSPGTNNEPYCNAPAA